MVGNHNSMVKMREYQMNKINCPHPECEWGVESNIEHDQSVVNIIAYHYARHTIKEDEHGPRT